MFWYPHDWPDILFGMANVTQILSRMERGDAEAAEQLLPLVYEELRKLAAAKLAQERPGQTLQATALVHEAYLCLVGNSNDPGWENRGHFFAAAAEAMRRILVDRARHRTAEKHGGLFDRIELNDELAVSEERSTELLALDEALTDLEQQDEAAARLVKLRYFAGLSHQEAAASMALTRRAADRLWMVARAWLFQRLREKE